MVLTQSDFAPANTCRDIPRWLGGKESACDAGDLGLISELGRSAGEGKVYPLQYSCLDNPMDREAWRATGHRVAKSQTQHRVKCENCLSREMPVNLQVAVLIMERIGHIKNLSAYPDNNCTVRICPR